MPGPGWENAEHCAYLRARVDQLVWSRWDDALTLAIEIPLPWYRVQSLARVAEAAEESRVDEVLAMALKEAAKSTDAYRRVAVLRWVIEAARRRDRKDLAETVLRGAIVESAAVTPLQSRGKAIDKLLQEAVYMGEPCARLAADALLDVAQALKADPIRRWRKWSASFVNYVVCALRKDHRSLTEELLTSRFGAERCAEILARHPER